VKTIFAAAIFQFYALSERVSRAVADRPSIVRREAQTFIEALSQALLIKPPLAGGRYWAKGAITVPLSLLDLSITYLLIHLHGGQGLPPVSLRNGLSILRISLPIIYCASGTFRPLVHFHLASTGPGSRL